MKQKVYFRADGNSSMGLGHLYRCAAVAEMLSPGYECHLFARDLSDALHRHLADNFAFLHSIPSDKTYRQEALEWSAGLDGSIILVLDGYNFTDEYQLILKSKNCRLVCIDDIHAYHFFADAVINHAGGLTAAQYSIEPYTQLYLGPEYAMVRKEFNEKPDLRNRKEDHVLISMGGADPNNDTVEVLKLAAKLCPSLTYNVLLGNAYRYRSILETEAAALQGLRLEIHQNLDVPALKKLMEKCGIAICAPSTVSFEYMTVGGEIYLHKIADNQADIFRFWTGEGYAFPFDMFRVQTRSAITAVLDRQHQTFDGKNRERLRRAITGR